MIDDQSEHDGRALPGEKAPRRWPLAQDTVIALLVFGLAFWQLLPGVENTPFHRDEARWINRVQLLKEWRHPLGSRWQDDGYPIRYGSLDERYRMRGQPPFASYLLGLGLLLQGQDLTTNGFWIMDQDDAWNADHGNMPGPADLRAARRTNVVLAALTVVAVYFIGKRLTNRVGGAVGAGALAIHPLLYDVATRAWADTALIFLLVLAAVAAYRLTDQPTWPRAILLGALLGLAGATKLSPLLLTVPIAALGGILLITPYAHRSREALSHPRDLAWKLVAIPLFTYLTFVASYPYLWPRPVEHTYILFKFRADSFRTQALAFPPAKVHGLVDAFHRVSDELGTRFSASGHLVTIFQDQTGLHVPPSWHLGDLDLALAAIGLEVLIALVIFRGLRGAPALVAIIVAGDAALVIVTMGVEYARYLIPVLLVVVIGVGLVAGQTWSLLHHLITSRDTRAGETTNL